MAKADNGLDILASSPSLAVDNERSRGDVVRQLTPDDVTRHQDLDAPQPAATTKTVPSTGEDVLSRKSREADGASYHDDKHRVSPKSQSTQYLEIDSKVPKHCNLTRTGSIASSATLVSEYSDTPQSTLDSSVEFIRENSYGPPSPKLLQEPTPAEDTRADTPSPGPSAQADMTAEENEQEDIEAAEQAEGAIVVDLDDMTDAGYESDAVTSASTSITSSVRNYAFENGRRYHKFREGRYNFPNDEVEQEREDMKHAMVKMLCQQLHFAPIGEKPQEILDIGTGTGAWAIEMGDEFPSATVLGIDLSPIQPEWVPPNVRFMVDDAESPWLHPRNHFDYIHTRHTVMAIKDWPRLFRRASEHLRPGGWMEVQEIYHYPIAIDDNLKLDHPVVQYWHVINEGMTALGVDFHAASGGRLANMMRDCGFVNVTERIFHVPIGPWAKNRVLKTVGLYWRTILLDGIQAIAYGPLIRGCKWTREEVELFLVKVRKAYFDNSCLMYMPLHIIYAQKPGH